MREWLTPALLIICYFALMKFVLPRLGVPT